MALKKGDLVTRDFPSVLTRVIQGATYTVAQVNDQGTLIQVEGDSEWYVASKFTIVGPYDR